MHIFLQVVFAIFLSLTKAGQSRPIPPGIRDADARVNKPVEPPALSSVNSIDMAKLKREAEELARVAGTIPGEMALTAQGQLPRDLSDKLKRVEKLAKHLRSEISN